MKYFSNFTDEVGDLNQNFTQKYSFYFADLF